MELTRISAGYLEIPNRGRKSFTNAVERLLLPIRFPLLRNGSDYMLIDSGMVPEGFRSRQGIRLREDDVSVSAQLESAATGASAVTWILMTHGHYDHLQGIMGADGSRRYPRATLVMHELEFAEFVRHREDSASFYDAELETLMRRYSLRLLTGEQGELAGLKWQWTGGHTPGHTIWRDGQRIFTGDLLPVPAAFRLARAHESDYDPDRAAWWRRKLLEDCEYSEYFLYHGQLKDDLYRCSENFGTR